MSIKNKLLKLFSNYNLMTQVMLVSGIVIVLLTVMTFIFTRMFIHRYEIMLNSQLSTILEISSDSVQSAVDDMENSSIDVMIDDDFQMWFKSFSHGDAYSYEDFVASSAMNKYILDFVNENSAVKFALLLDDEYRTVVSAMGSNPAWNSSKSQLIKNNMRSGERYKLMAPTEELNELIAVREVVDLSDPTLATEGFLIIGIDINALVGVTNTNLEDYPLSSLIMFEDDVLHTDFETDDEAQCFMEQIISEGADKTETRFEGKRYYRTYKELETPGLKYAVYVLHSDVFGELEQLIDIAIIIFVLMVLMLFYISYRATKRMTRPLSDLSNQMKKVQTGVFEGVEINSEIGTAEINSLAEDFNVMVGKIDTLIQENFLEKMLLQESELKLLQSQINPHFLYNTLESINWMAKSGRTKEISVMVQALSKLFRNAVSNKETAITVKEELDLLWNYIAIQKIRFEDRLEPYVDVEDEFLNYKIPKFILQPLVENSIKYALERYSTTCVIKVYAKRSETGMKLYIEDNGPGIDEAQLERIRTNQPVESKSGIALKNIRRRLEIMYHTDNAMEFESKMGKGTTIIINIPKET
ncbi:MAG: sensor histidine kinase [Clostridia bacterium]